jgi:membrane protein required for colicin V production
MNWLDVVLLILLAWSIVTSFRKGFTREVIGLVSVILALLLGIWFYGTAGSYLVPYLSSRAAANLAGFLVVFCGVLLLGSLVSFVLGKFLKVTGLSIIDHALGAGFGLARGILISVALIVGIMAFSQGDRPPASVVNSRLAPYVVDTAGVFAAMAPHELKEGFRKTYAEVKTAWGSAIQKGLRSGPDGGRKEGEGKI